MMEKTLPEVCIIQYGFPFDSSKFCRAEGVPLVRIRDVVRGYSETYTTEIVGENYIVNDGDLLIGMDGEFNIAYWKGGRAYLNQRVCRLIPREDVDRDYIFYYMPQALKAIEDATPFVTVKHLSAKQLSKILIPLPDMSEQQRISAVLRSVDRVIAMRKKELDELNNLVKSRFIELFGDPVRNSMGLKTIPLGKACCLKAGITTSADMIHEQSNEFSVPCYGGNGIRGYVESATQCGCYPIIGRQGALCGNVQLATGIFHATEHAVLVTPLIETNVVWLFYLLKMMDLYRFHTGAAQPGLAVKTLNTVDIPIADVAMQHQFAAFVEQTDKSKLCGKMEVAA